MKPMMVGDPPSQRLRIGFVARQDIEMGEGLFFKYGVKDKHLPWLATSPKQVATRLQIHQQNHPTKQIFSTSKKKVSYY